MNCYWEKFGNTNIDIIVTSAILAVVSGRENVGKSQTFVNFVNIIPSQKFVPYSM